MEPDKIIMLGIYALILGYMLYRLVRKNPMKKEYERLYKDVLNSKKYKVKGQYDDK